MSLSRDSRLKNIEDSLGVLMDELHGHTFLAKYFDERYLDSRIFSTTWEELKARGWLIQTSNRWTYTLSGRGWIEGLKLRDQYNTQEMRTETGRLCAALKDKVKGRQESATAIVSELAHTSGLSENFIRDAIEANLISELFGIHGAEWDHRPSFIHIPVSFGLEPL